MFFASWISFRIKMRTKEDYENNYNQDGNDSCEHVIRKDTNPLSFFSSFCALSFGGGIDVLGVAPFGIAAGFKVFIFDCFGLIWIVIQLLIFPYFTGDLKKEILELRKLASRKYFSSTDNFFHNINIDFGILVLWRLIFLIFESDWKGVIVSAKNSVKFFITKKPCFWNIIPNYFFFYFFTYPKFFTDMPSKLMRWPCRVDLLSIIFLRSSVYKKWTVPGSLEIAVEFRLLLPNYAYSRLVGLS